MGDFLSVGIGGEDADEYDGENIGSLLFQSSSYL